jgi:putative tryptophan/tyrosine transport system substrate-binding protein
MRRREVLALLSGAATLAPLAARAQQADRVRRIGAIVIGTSEQEAQTHSWTLALRRGLQDHGWVEGRNIRIDLRWHAGDLDRMQTIAKELVDLKLDLIFAANTPTVLALRRETQEIPIVFANLSDPVGSGLVASLARPGGNITGFAAFEYSLGSKWLEMLKELAPNTKRVAVLFNPDTAPYAPLYVSSLQAAAPPFSMRLLASPVRNVGEIEQAVMNESRQTASSLIVLPDSYTVSHRAVVIALAARFRLPAVYAFRIQALDGGLVSYGPETSDLYRRAASYIDRILRGANPADMPVQHPTKYELVINLKTAKGLGLEVSSFFQQRADEVIE